MLEVVDDGTTSGNDGQWWLCWGLFGFIKYYLATEAWTTILNPFKIPTNDPYAKFKKTIQPYEFRTTTFVAWKKTL